MVIFSQSRECLKQERRQKWRYLESDAPNSNAGLRRWITLYQNLTRRTFFADFRPYLLVSRRRQEGGVGEVNDDGRRERSSLRGEVTRQQSRRF